MRHVRGFLVRWRKLLPLMLVVALPILVLLQNVSWVRAEPTAKIVNTGTYIDSSKLLHVLGEVVNIGDVNLMSIFVNGSLYNATNHLVERQSIQLMSNILEPGQKAPFELVMSKSGTLVLTLQYKATAERLEEQLELFQAYTTKFLQLRAVGWVKNNGKRWAGGVRVIGTFYDEKGRVVHAEYFYSIPSVIPTGSGAYFQITIVGLRAQSIRSYALFAESNEYRSAVQFFTILSPS